MNLTGPFCLRGRGKGTKNAAAFNSRSGGSAAFHCRNPGTTGVMHFQGSGNTNVSTQFFAGNVFRGTNFDRPYWISTGTAVESCSGAIALSNAPGNGGTWHVRIATSTTPLGPNQGCADLSYTVTGDTCTITSSNKECHFSPVPSAVPAGGCVQLRGSCTGTCTATTAGPNYGLDCRAASNGGFGSGGLTYETAGSGAFDNCAHCFNTGPWAISDLAAVPAATLGQQYWIAPTTGLAGCAGAFTFTSPPSGGGQYRVGLRTSTTGLMPGQGCLDLTYTDTGPLCTMGGGDKSCVFPLTSMTIPPNACFALMVTKSASAPPGASGNEFNWQASCVAN
jgi:hypothetical protein